jgi:5'-3' exonuclease
MMEGCKYPSTFIMNYCFAMTTLGNDFLPSSLSFKIREDGHSDLVDILKGISDDNKNLTSFDNLLQLFSKLAAQEESRVLKYVQKKHSMGHKIELEKELGENNWPLYDVEEDILLNGKYLAPDWKDKYMTYFSGFNYSKRDIYKLCKEYLYGIQWTWAYYMGEVEKVCFNWYYPFGLPPLWSWICNYMAEKQELPLFPDRVLVKATDIKPVEQLALVLPLESWSLIPVGIERNLPKLAPQFYPSRFSFESVGKRYFWECESIIPMPSILEIKEIIKSITCTA